MGKMLIHIMQNAIDYSWIGKKLICTVHEKANMNLNFPWIVKNNLHYS